MPYRHEPNYIFSVMGFPSLDRKTGRHTEYCEVLGQTVILPEREWLQLPEKFVPILLALIRTTGRRQQQ